MSNQTTHVELRHNLDIRKGLDLKIKGGPKQEFGTVPEIKIVALLGQDYPFLKPSFQVGVGDKVKLGQALFTDRRNPQILFTSPGAGKVISINRGDRRSFQSIVVELSGNQEITFKKYPASKLTGLSRKEVQQNLFESGLWTTIRNRPFSNVADPVTGPRSIFITAADTNPHAPDPEIIIQEKETEFNAGVTVLLALTDGNVYVARKKGSKINEIINDRVGDIQVSGPHPAGNVGTHIHFIDPVCHGKNVWHVGYQNVIAIGHLFLTGKILTERVISVAGPSIKNPNLIRTRVGASTDDIVAGRLLEGEIRVVSGSLLSGHQATGAHAFLGIFHNQVSALREDRERRFLGWLAPGFNLFSTKNVFLSRLSPGKEFDFSTNTNGAHRAMVPNGNYEDVMPLDIIPTFLLRALLMKNLEWAEELGVLELDEEDLALCTFVSTGKDDFGVILRENLIRLEKEG